jgi:hypothetical protein
MSGRLENWGAAIQVLRLVALILVLYLAAIIGIRWTGNQPQPSLGLWFTGWSNSRWRVATTEQHYRWTEQIDTVRYWQFGPFVVYERFRRFPTAHSELGSRRSRLSTPAIENAKPADLPDNDTPPVTSGR